MDGDVFVAMVVNVDGDDVALARVDGWPGELPVHGEDALPLAEPGVVSFLYLQVKFCLTIQHQKKCAILCICFFLGHRRVIVRDRLTTKS
jgi:hypothetical protein